MAVGFFLKHLSVTVNISNIKYIRYGDALLLHSCDVFTLDDPDERKTAKIVYSTRLPAVYLS